MNEQTANRIGVFNPSTEMLTEYTIPSRNPNWADCEGIDYCGVAQIFDFAVDGEKIWFTEWVENNIGVVDTSIPTPFSVDVDREEITLDKGQITQMILKVTKTSNNTIKANVNSSSTSTFSDIIITHENDFLLSDELTTITVEIMASEHALSGTHKILLGAYTDDIAVSKFVTVTVV